MSTVTLRDGRQVDSASEEWRAECLQRWEEAKPECDRHVRELQGIRSTDGRRAYLSELESRGQKSMADRVRVEFAKWWKAQQQARARNPSNQPG